MKINIDEKKMMDFAEYVSDFSKNISTECSEINAATIRMEKHLDNKDVAEIRRLTYEISRILDDSSSDLETLSEKIKEYSLFVSHIKAMAKK